MGITAAPFAQAGYLIEVRNQQGFMVRISYDGKVEYGKDYTPEEAAKQFWEALVKYNPAIIENQMLAEKLANLAKAVDDAWGAIALRKLAE
jgi:hypothetical protein